MIWDHLGLIFSRSNQEVFKLWKLINICREIWHALNIWIYLHLQLQQNISNRYIVGTERICVVGIYSTIIYRLLLFLKLPQSQVSLYDTHVTIRHNPISYSFPGQMRSPRLKYTRHVFMSRHVLVVMLSISINSWRLNNQSCIDSFLSCVLPCLNMETVNMTTKRDVTSKRDVLIRGAGRGGTISNS